MKILALEREVSTPAFPACSATRRKGRRLLFPSFQV